jgi:hypothetical protein
VGIALATAGCASGGASAGPQAGPPVQEYATEAERATAPAQPLHIVFSWSLQERDGRFSGRGSTRMEPPGRARLDLFGPRGETYLSAALVDTVLRLPPNVQDAPLPPAGLLWAALGIFRPPAGARLTGSARTGATTRLDYARGEERWTFRLEGDQLRYAEWVGPGDGRRTVELEGSGANRIPQRAVYRDWPAFRELRLTLEEVNATNGFPADIWEIGR